MIGSNETQMGMEFTIHDLRVYWCAGRVDEGKRLGVTHSKAAEGRTQSKTLREIGEC